MVGLGNPGPRYAGNRHNVGFMVVDLLAARIGRTVQGAPRSADVVEGRLRGRSSRTGQAEVVHERVRRPDRRDLPGSTRSRWRGSSSCTTSSTCRTAPLRIKRGGGEGGHNGLRSATAVAGHKDYLRVRFGIGRPPGRQDPADYVLRDFAATERKELTFLVDRAADAVEALLADGLDTRVQQLAGR